MKSIPAIIEIPQNEQKSFDELIRKYRIKHIRDTQEIVNHIFSKNKHYNELIKKKAISKLIKEVRKMVWAEYLKDEVKFNAILMKDLYKILKTPKEIIDTLLYNNIVDIKGEKLIEKIKELCGEYAGRVFPYIYRLSLSNTQSRRTRAGKEFELIIYRIYEMLNYEFESQSKVGRKIFEDVGLGKKVDSILPNIESFKRLRNKTIIGTMKTSLRERWQEVAEEIERTKIPVIHLLTADENINDKKADAMSKHNIIIVTYDNVANSESLKNKKNIISFEEYLFIEIPNILEYWKREK